jgi:hypothetical protein
MITHQVADGPRHMTDPDGLTSHSVVTFRYRLAPRPEPRRTSSRRPGAPSKRSVSMDAMATSASSPANSCSSKFGDGAVPEVFTHSCLINTTRGISFKSNMTETEVADCTTRRTRRRSCAR